jgi:hypothetical protein
VLQTCCSRPRRHRVYLYTQFKQYWTLGDQLPCNVRQERHAKGQVPVAVTFMFHSRNAPISNLSPETGNSEFRRFLQSRLVNAVTEPVMTSAHAMTVSSAPFTFHLSQLPYYSTL